MALWCFSTLLTRFAAPTHLEDCAGRVRVPPLYRLRHCHIVWQCSGPDLGISLQEFNIEKLHMLEAEKGRVRKDSERREGLIETKKKIEYSKQLNASRIKVPFCHTCAILHSGCRALRVEHGSERQSHKDHSRGCGVRRDNPQTSSEPTSGLVGSSLSAQLCRVGCGRLGARVSCICLGLQAVHLMKRGIKSRVHIANLMRSNNADVDW